MVERTDCKCMTLPLDYGIRMLLPEGDRLNTEVTAGDVELFHCSLYGTKWLRQTDEWPAFSESGRWYLAPVTDAELAELHATKDVLGFLRSRPWHFYGGSYFRTAGALAERKD
jgi:hypothetical protein